ncbi:MULTISPECIES: DUF6254 family protein [Bacillaceae]|uniref:DUF6254 family protein n=1 Tax=Metabacillus sediminis TaxID=3117746 RepID=A0ABZ2NM96_9BACI|nr:DUF6254 family protein [Bacillus sp. SJS]
MSQSKKQEERQWKDHKQAQHPHGEVKSLKELSRETDKDSKRS